MNMRDFRRLASASAKSPSAENSLASSANLVSISAAVSSCELWQRLDLTGGNAGLEVVKNSQLGFAERLDHQGFAIPVLPDVVGKPEPCQSGIDLGCHVGSVANICRMILGFSTALVIE